MSLQVPASLAAKAASGDLTAADAIDCIRESLPHAWAILEEAAMLLRHQGSGPAVVEPEDMTEEKRAQLLRALSSNAIRGAVEEHFGVRYAFQNCHKTGAFLPDEVGNEAYREFTSIREQLLNQRPEFLHC